MIYYKNLEDALTSSFEELGYKDGDGNPIKSTGEPISRKEHTRIRVETLQKQSSKMKVEPIPFKFKFLLCGEFDDITKEIIVEAIDEIEAEKKAQKKADNLTSYQYPNALLVCRI